ncbi:MAG: hypothetical protein HN353_12795 [Bdellovibrionales bacterium]|jgi:hypothetical protein|nr:hypothetical protein [Bdellovibrionales bacterium]MBT3525330.1 hypothetical protein [Bdellovibrionales bacterium]MBT7669817.1 hypothetical protein [Bdellovibrionales bacterium]MBT7765550.1 hypothetical protein [Bdellovibrionales bacterium]
MITTLPMIISEQSLLKFTGRVNLLSVSNSGHLGAIFFKQGILVHARYREQFAIRALENIITEIYKHHTEQIFKYVIEPEIIFEHEHSFSLDGDEFNQLLIKIHREYDQLLKQRPSDSLQIKINATFLHQGEGIDTNEFDLLKLLSSQQSIADLSAQTTLTEFELLKSIISLRKKGAIRVLAIS